MTVFKSIIDKHPNPCVVHINFVPVYANDAFAEFSGFSSATDVLTLPSLKTLFVKEHWAEAEARYLAVINDEVDSAPMVIEHTDINGVPKLAEITDSVVDWHGHKAMCTFISVVTDTVRREEKLKDLALRDELTGIMNRRYLMERMNCHHRPYRQDHHYLALIDLDHFKQVNDTYGHLTGDALLRAVASTLSTLFDSYHKVSRIGGEEFAMILSADSHPELLMKVKAIQKAVRQTCVEEHKDAVPEKRLVSCTASIGVSGYRQDDDFSRWFSRADVALYKAKNQGRNMIIFDTAVVSGEVSVFG
ncbi:sensor domain-containing diguanylate cyclase [Thaumasiovibrio subtropicus]|uniref:sensor domain-containing diguanylate cyclase n=1 Tax=Thaumasiovibrio subtropicus TaxID=1891207 RepID=UPI000B35AE9A|nr:GGDEF domain-containing protein [Thaumasiovibrio subtropicus]